MDEFTAGRNVDGFGTLNTHLGNGRLYLHKVFALIIVRYSFTSLVMWDISNIVEFETFDLSTSELDDIMRCKQLLVVKRSLQYRQYIYVTVISTRSVRYSGLTEV